MCFFLLGFLRKSDGINEKEIGDEDSSLLRTIIGLLTTLWNWSVIIVMSILPAILPFDMYYVTVIISMTLSIVVLLVEGLKYKNNSIKVFPKHIDVGLPIFNIGLLIWVLICPPPSSWKHRLYISAIVNGCFFLFALGTLLMRCPFTIQYAMESVPEDIWTKRSFYDTNHMITTVWMIMWLVSATYSLLVSLYASQDDLNNESSVISICDVVVPIVLLICAIKFTSWYPQHVRQLIGKQNIEKVLLTDKGSNSV